MSENPIFHCADQNFDGLAARFSRNIYGSLKGQVRLQVIDRDLREWVPQVMVADASADVLDVGAGQALMSIPMAVRGCRVVINDLSAEMLDLARASVDAASENLNSDSRQALEQRLRWFHGPLQTLESQLQSATGSRQFDLVLCHAVMEWMADPPSLPGHLLKFVRPGGYLSLTAYNLNGLAFKNLLRTNFNKFHYDSFTPSRGSLTPRHPQVPSVVREQLESVGFQVVCVSGIRVFHDYILDRQQREAQPEALLARELEYSRREPFWQMARYIHYVARRAE